MVSFPGRTHFYLVFDLCGRTFSQLATLMGQKKDLSTVFCAETLYASGTYCARTSYLPEPKV
jgi:hypothetical protein